MFRATSFHSIDDKNRLKIPARFRDVIRAAQTPETDEIVLTGLDNGLVAYTPLEWDKIETRILNQAEKSEGMRLFRTFFVGAAARCTCDKQDRILIPPMLRDYAGIEKEIVLVGVLDHFEIWSRSIYDERLRRLAEASRQDSLRKDIEKLGL